MLSKREAVRIGRRGGKKRMYSLSPEKRTEIASWARLIREQKARGEVTETQQRRRLIHLVQAEDPELAALLKFLSKISARRAAGIYFALPDEQRGLIEQKLEEVLCA